MRHVCCEVRLSICLESVLLNAYPTGRAFVSAPNTGPQSANLHAYIDIKAEFQQSCLECCTLCFPWSEVERARVDDDGRRGRCAIPFKEQVAPRNPRDSGPEAERIQQSCVLLILAAY